MIRTEERGLPGEVEALLSIFQLANAFSTYMNTVNLNIFHNHSEIYRFAKKINKTYGEMSPVG